MKHIKKLLALVLSLLMALSMATSVFAAEDTDPNTFTITITAPADATLEGHTYEVYQIFTGDLAGEEPNQILSNVKYGENYGTEGEEVPESVLTNLAGMTGEAAAEYLSAALAEDEEPFAVLTAPDWTYENAPAGYYLIIDVSENLPEGETSSAFILELIDDADIVSKHTAGLKVVKKIDDTNDSTDATNEIIWHDSADHDIGDDIPFKLEMTVPAVFAQFKTYNEAYRFVFHDTEEDGLKFNNDAVVYVGDDVLSKEYYEVVSPAADGHSFDVIFADLTAIEGLKPGDTITVLYTSELTEDAVLGNQGNVNKVYGEFSNLHRPEYPGFTPEDTVIAFTYKVVVNKVDQDKEPLAGAEFKLEKYNKATDSWVEITRVTVTEETVFTFKGLDDGNYRLTETKTPAGYNTIDPVEFTVTADHDIEWETQGRTDVLTSLTGDVTTGEIEFTETVTDGTLSTDVENKSGTILPETGGIGTTIFYVLGGGMVLVAIVLLVTKKRMGSAE